MENRHPSSAVASTSSSMRRRSGALSPNLNGASPTILHSPNPYQLSLTVQVEDVAVVQDYAQPTILLVPPAHPSPPLPALPAYSPAPSQGEPFTQVQEHNTRPAHNQTLEPFSLVPLTPRPDASIRGMSETSMHSSQSSSSQISRLPSPDFTARNLEKNTVRSFLPRGLSFLSFGGRRAPPLNFESFIKNECPQSARSESGRSNTSSESVVSRSSYASSTSTDTGHLSLIPSIGTTEKFTHKWPKPQTIRSLTVKRGGERVGAGISEAVAALEDGEGLGMDKIDRWTIHKWCLMLSVSTVFACGVTGLVCAIKTWFRTWEQADVMTVVDGDILILITLASSILLFTSLVGTTGALLNSRPILAIYALLLWPALVSILAVGYISYKRYAFALDQKLNLAWSQYYTPLGRLLIQDSLRCCGYYSALHEAIPSGRCYPRTALPGCKGKIYRFERTSLATVWSATFSVVPLHILNVFVALLCANHMTRTFGKGVMPKKYRLSGVDVKADAEKILKRVGEGTVVVRPEMSKASSSAVFREDRAERKIRFE